MTIVDSNIKVGSIAEIEAGLNKLGVSTGKEDDHLVVRMQADNKQVYGTTLHIREQELVIACQVGTMADIEEADFPKAAYAALACNAEILPYAFAILPGSENQPDSIILVNSVPLGDLSLSELQAAMDSLRRAIHLAIDMVPWKRSACASCPGCCS